MAYTTIDDPTQYFNTVLYTGNGSTQSVTGVGFQPDWVWNKNRSSARNHYATDSVRGVQKTLRQNVTDDESTNSGGVTAFNSDGFSVGSDNVVNESGDSLVAWNWLAGTSFSNDASSTSVGTIDSSGSTNQTAGFSIVSWTGTGSAGTVAHNLGSVPEWYIIKNRSDANNWAIYHQKSNSNPEQYALYLDGTSAATDDSGLANDTAPTSTVFSLTNGNYGNQNTYNYIGYFFSEVKGYSKFGSYQGNANGNGTFIHTGFKPAWVMIKNISAGSTDWYMYDNKRGGPAAGVYGNNNKYFLKANTNSAEANENLELFSNGFKLKITNAFLNGNGNTFIYMAFAESPFVNSNGIPTNAR